MSVFQRLFILSILAVVGSFCPTQAGATTVRGFTTHDMVREAAVVVRVRVEAQVSVWNRAKTAIYTHTTVKRTERLVGKRAPVRLTVRQLGGTVGDVSMMVPGTATLKVGQEVVLFLRTDGRYFYLVGMAQGAFRVHKQGKKEIISRDLGGLNRVWPRRGKAIGHTPPKQSGGQTYRKFVKRLRGFARTLGR